MKYMKITKHRPLAFLLVLLMFGSLICEVPQARSAGTEELPADTAITLEVSTTSGITKQASGTDYLNAMNNIHTPSNRKDINKIRFIRGKITTTDWTNLFQFTTLSSIVIEKDVQCEAMPFGSSPNASGTTRKLTEFSSYSNIPNIGSYAFSLCVSLEKADISGGAETIAADAFAGCKNLRQVILPDNLKQIDTEAFYNCPSLTEIYLPASLNTIGSSAFGACSALRTISIPDSVTSMGASAFSNCSMLEKVTLPDNKQFDSIPDKAFSNCEKLRKINIPDNIKTIGAGAFDSCADLEEITLPNGIRLSNRSFANCKNLKSLKIIVKKGSISSEDTIAPINSTQVPFDSLPSLRTLAFYTEEGTPLTETTSPTITEAMRAYAGVNDGNTTDEKWYGWDIVRAFSINNELTNLVSSNSDTDYRPANGDYTTTLSVDKWTNPQKTFALPKTISVSIGNGPAIAGIHYTYDSETGELTIPKEYITGDVTIKADAVDVTSYYIQIQSSGDGTTNLYVNHEESPWDSPVQVMNSDNVVLTLLPKEGFVVDTLTVNGIAQPITDPAGFSHPLDINQNYIVDVSYAKALAPTLSPTAAPTPSATIPPTASPTLSPSVPPTSSPTLTPSAAPSATPDITPAARPTQTVSPTITPSVQPSTLPAAPNATPAVTPTPAPNSSLSELINGLGVSAETANRIQKAANELAVSKDTLLVTDETITSQKTDDDIAGSYYSRIQARAAQTSEGDIRLVWNRIKGADGYRIFSNRCNTRKHIYEYKLTKTITNASKKSYIQRKRKKGTYYKFIVRAYKEIDGKKVTIAVSKTIHATTLGGKYGNPQTIRLKKYKAGLKPGKTFRIKAKEIHKNKPLRHHREIKYESGNPKIAAVSAKGVVTAKKKGSCTIYAYAQNGVYKKIKISVK